ncbi:hypothetical protein N9V57_04085 [SAR86 cluster bacterium]|nr:hypothetical protein [SAR86 cluster bacterium]
MPIKIQIESFASIFKKYKVNGIITAARKGANGCKSRKDIKCGE